METLTIQLEELAGSALDAVNFPRHELASENILAAIRIEELQLGNAEAERKILEASIQANRPGLLKILDVQVA